MKKKKAHAQSTHGPQRHIGRESGDTVSVGSTQKEKGHNEKRPLFPFVLLAIFLLAWILNADQFIDPWNEISLDFEKAKVVSDTAARTDRMKDCLSRYQKLLERHPYHARLHYLVANASLLLHQYDSAIVHAKECIRLDSAGIVNQVAPFARDVYRDAVITKVNRQLQEKNYTAAQLELLPALAFESQNIQFLKLYANTQVLTGKHDSAIAYFERVVARDSTDADVHFALASIEVNRKNYAAAKLRLQTVMRLRPNHDQARAMLLQLSSVPTQ